MAAAAASCFFLLPTAARTSGKGLLVVTRMHWLDGLDQRVDGAAVEAIAIVVAGSGCCG